MVNATSSVHLTGFSYLDWEQDTAFIETAAVRLQRTGFFDATHLERAREVRAALADELHVVDDVRALSDPETAAEFDAIRTRLAGMRDRILRIEAMILRALSRPSEPRRVGVA